jgi:hypothetical protein
VITNTKAKALPNARIKARETEIARRLLHVLERLPVRAMQNFVQNLADSIPRVLEEPASGAKGKWVAHVLNGTVLLPWDCFAHVEIVKAAEGTQERLDLVLPTAPVLVGGRLITSLVFEFKLHSYQLAQLTAYAAALPNSLLVSISKQEHGVEQIALNTSGATVVFQTWEHLYFAFARMLSGDPAPRLVRVDEPPDLLLNFDHRVAGQDRVSFEIESFLELLLNRDLLPNRDLVLVVPRGAAAQSTLQHTPPYYRHPESWRAGYRYVVSIYRNRIEDIFEVVHSITTDRVDDTPPPAPIGFAAKEWEDDIASSPGSRISVLKPLDSSDPHLGIFLGRQYEKVGPKGRPAAFVQTHRYLDHPLDLGDHFKSGKTS